MHVERPAVWKGFCVAIVVAEALTKRWGDRPVLVDANFRVDRGVTGLLGANGSGKTTLFGMLLGLHAPNSGGLSVLDLDPRTAGPVVRQRLGYSPEHEALPPDMSAYDFVRHVAELHGLPRRAAAGRASDALYEVGLGEERARPCGTMSTGQKQRVKLAQSIAHDPQLVLLDEPTNGLDPVQRDEMLKLIRRCGHELGLSIIVSSHLLDEIERTCDQVLIVANNTITGRDLAPRTAEERAAAPLEIELIADADSVERFVTALRRAGCDASRHPDRRATVVVLSRPGIAAATEPTTTLPNGAGAVPLAERANWQSVTIVVRDTLVAQQLAVRSIRRRDQSLEDVFFEATR